MVIHIGCFKESYTGIYYIGLFLLIFFFFFL